MRSKNERGVRDIGHHGFPREVVPVAECESIEVPIADLVKAHALPPAREGTLLYVPEPYDDDRGDRPCERCSVVR